MGGINIPGSINIGNNLDTVYNNSSNGYIVWLENNGLNVEHNPVGIQSTTLNDKKSVQYNMTFPIKHSDIIGVILATPNSVAFCKIISIGLFLTKQIASSILEDFRD